MANTEPQTSKRKTLRHSEAPPGNPLTDKTSVVTAKRLETVVAVLLGITTLLSAWASWIGHLHGGLQSINFTSSNNAASQGTAEYSLGMQLYLADYMAWNTAREYYYELEAATVDGDQEKIDLINQKIKTFVEQNASSILIEGFQWMEENNEDNPFKMPGMAKKYFESAEKTAALSQELLEEGKRDNTKGDSYMLVTVIYSLTLFLLGIVGTFKSIPNRVILLAIAVFFLVFAVVYMCTIPLPTGFEKMNFFEFKR